MRGICVHMSYALYVICGTHAGFRKVDYFVHLIDATHSPPSIAQPKQNSNRAATAKTIIVYEFNLE